MPSKISKQQQLMRSQSPLFLSQGTSNFQQIFPNVSKVNLKITESLYGNIRDVHERSTYNLQPYLVCGNRSCTGGAINIENILYEMAENGEIHRQIDKKCEGRERLGASCMHHYKGEINVTYMKATTGEEIEINAESDENHMHEIIPENALALMPFSAQAYSKWEARTDLDVIYFLLNLFDKTDQLVLPDGTQGEMNYKYYALQVFNMSTRTIEAVAKALDEAAHYYVPTPNASVQYLQVPVFLDDNRFGLAAKYLIAWDGVYQEVMSEGAFFSLAHFEEANSDLECSKRMAISIYYKQALQVLRSYIENIVLPLYFCADPQAFQRWKRGNFRVPNFRGNEGMLTVLVDQYILSPELANKADKLYGELNEAVHGSERNLIHSGVYEGKWSGHIFNDRKFGHWCDYLSRAIDLGIRLTQINMMQWKLAKPTSLMCQVCHSHTNLNIIEGFEHGGVQMKLFRCTNCGNKFAVRETGETGNSYALYLDGQNFYVHQPE